MPGVDAAGDRRSSLLAKQKERELMDRRPAKYALEREVWPALRGKIVEARRTMEVGRPAPSSSQCDRGKVRCATTSDTSGHRCNRD